MAQFIFDIRNQGICNLHTIDKNGNKIILRSRDCGMLYQAFVNGLFTIKLNSFIKSIQVKSNLNKINIKLIKYDQIINEQNETSDFIDRSENFLNETICYIV